MNKEEIENKIKEILKDIDYYQPEMIIQDKGIFFRMHPDWVKDKSRQLSTLIQESNKEARNEEAERWINQPANEHDNRIREEAVKGLEEEVRFKLLASINSFLAEKGIKDTDGTPLSFSPERIQWDN